jgi:predicted Zn finger-like uncharacterized protein
MILTCPACDTRFLVEGLVLPDEGQQVRCGRCKYVWHQQPVVPDTAIAESASPDWTSRPLPGNGHHHRPVLWLPAAGLTLLLAVLIWGVYLARMDIVAAWEPAARLYEAAHLPVPVAGAGLDLENLVVKTYRTGDKVVLLVAGDVVNPGKTSATVPPLSLTVRDTARRNLLMWQYTLPQTQRELAAGTRITFHTQQLIDNELATNLVVQLGGGGSNGHLATR